MQKNSRSYLFLKKVYNIYKLFRDKIILGWIPSKYYLKVMYRKKMGRRLNLKNPQRYTEKLQWLKVYDHQPIYTKMVDKFEAKVIAANVVGEESTIPTLGIWDNFQDIDFESLPNQFVLKCTHDSGGVVVCTDKAKFDFAAAQRKLEQSLKHNYYLHQREWPYKNVKPRIIAESYMIDHASGSLNDYKFFCFNGRVETMFIATERLNAQADTCFDFFDRDFNHLNVTNGHPNSTRPIARPDLWDEMIQMAEQLSKGFTHLRIDLYEINGKLYFGEYTFYHWSGLVPFQPVTFDNFLGSKLILPEKKY